MAQKKLTKAPKKPTRNYMLSSSQINILNSSGVCVKYLSTLVALFCFSSAFAAPSTSSPNHYTVHLSFDSAGRSLTGELLLQFTNNSNHPIKELPLVLYPNYYAEPPADLNDVNYEWHYPDRFNPGKMTLLTAKLAETALEITPTSIPTVNMLILSEQVVPGGTITLKVNFRTLVPKKYGSFGYYNGMWTLNGGWHPFIPACNDQGEWDFNAPPPEAIFDGLINYQGHLWIQDQHFFSTKGDQASFENLHGRFLSLILSDESRRYELQAGGIRATVYLRGKQRTDREQTLMENFTRVLQQIQQLSPTLQLHFSFVESHLRTDLAMLGGSHLMLFSDRVYKVFPPLRDYHSANLFQAALMLYALEKVKTLEKSSDQDWVAELISWHYTEALLDKVLRLERDARNLTLLRFFSFLPSIDQVIYTPQFPFTSSYYNLHHAADIYRSDITRYNRQTPSGRLIMDKFADFYGKEKLASIVQAYMQPNNQQSFQQLSTPRFLKQWLQTPLKTNYSISRIRRQHHTDGVHHLIEIKRSGDSLEFPEPVKIAVKDRWGKRTEYVWNSADDHYEIDFVSPTRLAYVQIDPENRLNDTDGADNRWPEKYKFVLTAFLFDLNFSDLQSQLLIATQWRKVFPDDNRYNFGFSIDEAGYSFSIGYSRLLGRLLDDLRLTHGIGFSFAFNQLDADFLRSSSSTISISPSGQTTTLSIGYGFSDRLAYFNPKQGITVSTFSTIGLKALGGDFNFFKSGISYVGILPFDPQHLLVGQIGMGISGGIEGSAEIPAQQQFTLGGVNSLRGFPFSDARLVGRNEIEFNAEYRHSWVNDLDWNFFEIARLRKIQGVLFADAGRVTDSIADEINTGSPPTGYDLEGLVDFSEYFSDVGYGLRFYVDALGIRNTLIRFDAATPTSPNAELDPVYYMSLTQAF
jgi:hypothetical protein